VAGIKIKAHPLFRHCRHHERRRQHLRSAEYIHSRLQPQILIDFPGAHERVAILRENLPLRRRSHPHYVTDFLQQAHVADERTRARDGINIARFAMKLAHQKYGARGRASSSERRSCRPSAKRALRYVPRN